MLFISRARKRQRQRQWERERERVMETGREGGQGRREENGGVEPEVDMDLEPCLQVAHFCQPTYLPPKVARHHKTAPPAGSHLLKQNITKHQETFRGQFSLGP